MTKTNWQLNCIRILCIGPAVSELEIGTNTLPFKCTQEFMQWKTLGKSSLGWISLENLDDSVSWYHTVIGLYCAWCSVYIYHNSNYCQIHVSADNYQSYLTDVNRNEVRHMSPFPSKLTNTRNSLSESIPVQRYKIVTQYRAVLL